MRTLVWFLALGCLLAGQESDPGPLSFLPVSEGPYHVTLGDLNGDGFDDAVIACRGELRLPNHERPGNDQISVYLSQPNGTPIRRDYAVGFGPYTAKVADLDNDDQPDVAVVNFQEPGGRDLSILWGRSGDDPLSPAVHIAVGGGSHRYEKSRDREGEPIYPAPGLTSLVIADFDGDGLPDIAAVAWSSDFLVILRNEGKRQFSQQRLELLPGPRDLVAADFDGDGIVDLAATIYSCNLIEVLRGDGQGHFTHWQRFHSQGHIPYHLQSGDIDGDGRTDLVVGNRGPSDDVACFRNTQDGFRHLGSFRTQTVVPGETTGDEIRDVLLTDIDGDGKLDLLAAAHVSHKVILWRGTGDVRFGRAFGPAREITFAGKGPRALARTRNGIAVAFYDTSHFATIPLDWLRALLR